MNSGFIDFEPEEVSYKNEIPFLEDVTKLVGWEGHTTQKDERTLLAEIMNEISYLGGQVLDWRKGTFADSYGKRIGYMFKVVVISPDGQRFPAKIEVVSLPVRKKTERNLSQSLRTALWNLRVSLAAGRRMECLVPGYRAIIGFLQKDQDGPTLSQSWLMSDQKALPMNDDDIVDGEEVK